jgi:hypothetical protein
MTDTDRIKKIVNSSGFPLQIGVADFVRQTEQYHRCKVRYIEHSWHDPLSGDSGFIDLVIEGDTYCYSFVVECKRVLESSWNFLIPKGSPSTRRHAKLWVTALERRTPPPQGVKTYSQRYFGWADLTLEPATPESAFCVVPGHDEKSRPMLERVASELVLATESFAREDEIRQAIPGAFEVRTYASVLVTTAKLMLATFDASAVSLEDGKIDDLEVTEVPFLRFRKQLSVARSDAEKAAYRANLDRIGYTKERTVFVVQAQSLSDFLVAFSVDDKPLIKLLG